MSTQFLITVGPMGREAHGNLLSDVMQADEAILWDRRGALMAQLQLFGIDPREAVAVLRRCADDLEARFLS